jgi:VanZ family protein
MQKPQTAIDYSSFARKCLKLRCVTLALWAFFILTFSLLPRLPEVPGPFSIDKFSHAIAYAGFAFFLARVLHQWRGGRFASNWQIWLLTMAFGGLVELLQFGMNIGRSAEWLDFFANGFGAWMACVLMRHTRLRRLVHAKFTDNHK